MNSDKVFVCLYSEANFLSLALLENLLSKNCYVLVITEDVNSWEEKSFHIGSKNRFSFIQPSEINKILTFNYKVFCGGFFKKADAYGLYRQFSENNNLLAPKTLAIFPFESFSHKSDAQLNVNSQVAAVYVGDLLGPRIDLESDLLLPRTVANIVKKRRIDVAVGEVFYPLFIADAAKTLTKWLLSFGPYGKSSFLLGSQVSVTDFVSANQKLVGETRLIQRKDGERRFVPRNYEVKNVTCNLYLGLQETYKWLSTRDLSKLRLSKIKNKKRYPKYFKPLILSLSSVLLLPMVLILVSLGILFLSYKDVAAGRSDSVSSKFLLSKTLFTLSWKESGVLKYVPVLGFVYREVEYISLVGEKTSSMALAIVPGVKAASELFVKILGDEIYDPSRLTQEIKYSLGPTYQEFSGLWAETKEATSKGTLSAKYLSNKVDFEKLGTYFEQGGLLLDGMPSFLGAGESKTYLVLLQNNMELRPTGGFIGSFGLVTFDGGRMSNLTVNDVYSADGQLRGHVEPPSPIKNYLNEANWWLRDSNWDPDFPTSAQRAEWFLDKEIDQKVDGVMAIDLNLVRDALVLTGPIFLSDYNLDITENNLYEETQAEVEEDFFPGSHQKASFLSALSRSLIAEVEKLGEGKKLRFLYALVTAYEERHIQTYLHNNSLQSSISALGWSGEVLDPSCGEVCYADLIGLTEANVGVNKANFFVKRNVNLNINLGPNFIERELTLNLENTANPALGESGRYKVYVRVFVPSDSELISVNKVGGGYEEGLTPETTQSHGRQEVGVITEVLGGTKQGIVFRWRTKSETNVNKASYGLYVRKQAGVSDDNWNIALTGGIPKTYNTILAKDFFARVDWGK